MNVLLLVISWCMVFAVGPVFGGEKVELKTEKDKLSYAVGADFANNLKKYEINLDLDLFMKGIKDSLSGGKTLLTEEEVKKYIAILQEDATDRMREKLKVEGEKNKKEGDAYLAENKKKPGVKTLPSGLQYKIITVGKGKPPAETDTVTVNYRGSFINGTEFDSSYKRGQPATFPVKGVIKGWTEALLLMKEGAKWQLVIPPDLAYGASGQPGIPPNSVLLFEVELIKIGAKEGSAGHGK
jgi:FKBP-type peptidyl-prolyl cis-trans isomerase FklB